MDKIEYRAVIKFFVKEGLTPNEIKYRKIRMQASLGVESTDVQSY